MHFGFFFFGLFVSRFYDIIDFFLSWVELAFNALLENPSNEPVNFF